MRSRQLVAGLVGMVAVTLGAVALPAAPASADTRVSCVLGTFLNPGGGPGGIVTGELCDPAQGSDNSGTITIGILVSVDPQGNQTGIDFDTTWSCSPVSGAAGIWTGYACTPVS